MNHAAQVTELKVNFLKWLTADGDIAGVANVKVLFP
jgi:hypothetical protein